MLNITKTQTDITLEKMRKLLLQRALTKRSNREGNIDENNKILKKQIKAKRVIYPTGTLLALTKQKKKTKTKVEIEGDVPSIVPERKKRKRKKKIMKMK